MGNINLYPEAIKIAILYYFVCHTVKCFRERKWDCQFSKKCIYWLLASFVIFCGFQNVQKSLQLNIPSTLDVDSGLVVLDPDPKILFKLTGNPNKTLQKISLTSNSTRVRNKGKWITIKYNYGKLI